MGAGTCRPTDEINSQLTAYSPSAFSRGNCSCFGPGPKSSAFMDEPRLNVEPDNSWFRSANLTDGRDRYMLFDPTNSGCCRNGG
jgi:hypothetical protein